MAPLHIDTIRENLLKKLQKLDNRLVYHNVAHTIDVYDQAMRIAASEDKTSPRDLFLLKLAALYHDSGFLEIYNGHEEVSCRIFMADAGDFGLTETEKQVVCDIIMATRITAHPTNHLQMVIRDADLDYLGRKDFDEISLTLKKELLDFQFIDNEKEWNERQLSFLRQHQYYTETSKKLRGPLKDQHLRRLHP